MGNSLISEDDVLMLIKGETETLKIYNSSVRSNFNAGNMSFSDELTVHVHI